LYRYRRIVGFSLRGAKFLAALVCTKFKQWKSTCINQDSEINSVTKTTNQKIGKRSKFWGTKEYPNKATFENISG
jgi:hypothetical protein